MGHKKERLETPKSFFGVINHPLKEKATKGDFGAFQDILTKSYGYHFLFASIVHDRDILEDGSLKTIHMHLFLAVREGDYETSEIIEKISKDFGIPKECVQMEEAGDNGACVKYLLHKNQKWKTQYLASEIKTNDVEALRPLLYNDFECLKYAIDLEQLSDWRGVPFVQRNLKLIETVKEEQQEAKIQRQELALYKHYYGLLYRLVHGEHFETSQLVEILKDIEAKIDSLRCGKAIDFLDD